MKRVLEMDGKVVKILGNLAIIKQKNTQKITSFQQKIDQQSN